MQYLYVNNRKSNSADSYYFTQSKKHFLLFLIALIMQKLTFLKHVTAMINNELQLSASYIRALASRPKTTELSSLFLSRFSFSTLASKTRKQKSKK